jgi:hypothetical protein
VFIRCCVVGYGGSLTSSGSNHEKVGRTSRQKFHAGALTKKLRKRRKKNLHSAKRCDSTPAKLRELALSKFNC